MGKISLILKALAPVAKATLKFLELIDPKTRDWVHKRKALEWAEQYIFKSEQLVKLLLTTIANSKISIDKKTQVKIERLQKSIRYRRKWFFAND